MVYCNFVPKYIIKNIAEKTKNKAKKQALLHSLNAPFVDLKLKREKITRELRAGNDPKVSLIRDHKERLIVYDNQNGWEYDKNTARLWEDFIQDHSVAGEEKKRPRRIFTKRMDEVHDMFHDLMERHSYDGQNAAIQCWLKFGESYVNAYWDGEYLCFGTGDNYYF